jgi:prephenate dehydratase
MCAKKSTEFGKRGIQLLPLRSNYARTQVLDLIFLLDFESPGNKGAMLEALKWLFVLYK